MRKITRRSFLTAAAACGAAAALSACGGSSSASSSAAASSTVASASVAAASNGEKFTVGICQLVQHAALDAATQGFEDALTASFGENVTFDFQNAQGDSATCATIANGFVSSGVALIMANATPALQAAQAATNTIPILGTSVTEYGVALGLDNFSGTVGGNVSGTSDLAPLDQQADMIVEWMPEVKKVGRQMLPLLCRLHRLLPTPSPFWALPLPSTAWHWVWITSPAPWAATSPAPPIWHRWISRQT